MGEDLDPWNRSWHSQWQFSGLNSPSNIQQPNIGHHNTNSLVLPTYISPYNCAFSATPLLGFQAVKSSQSASLLIPAAIPSYGSLELAGSENRNLVYDQSGNRTSLIFGSSGVPSLNLDSLSPANVMQGSNEANVSDGHEGEDEEMHEDTAEIDALLYSDSDYEYDEDEVSTGHSPEEIMEPVSSEVASSMLPTKRRRLDADEDDASLADTASSGVSSHPEIPTVYEQKEDDDDAQSSCVKGGECKQNFSNKRLKQARIQETVSMLRRIIPGGKGKDAATILDEAIRYLRSLKLKAKSLGATQM